MLFLYINIIIALLIPGAAFADGLSELKKSPAMTQFENKSARLRRDNRDIENWVKSDTNYAGLFKDRLAPKVLLQWVSPEIAGYVEYDMKSEKRREYVRAEAFFSARDTGDVIALQILVPHPRQIMSAKLGLISGMEDLKISGRAGVVTEELTIKGYPAKAFTDPKSCSIIIPLEKEGLLHVAMAKCSDKARLLKFAEGLSTGRLNRKLQS